MNKLITASLAGAFLLTGCTKKPYVNDNYDPEATHIMCVYSYVASTETIGIYFDTAIRSVPKVQYIDEISMDAANETIDKLGMCDEPLRTPGPQQ